MTTHTHTQETIHLHTGTYLHKVYLSCLSDTCDWSLPYLAILKTPFPFSNFELDRGVCHGSGRSNTNYLKLVWSLGVGSRKSIGSCVHTELLPVGALVSPPGNQPFGFCDNNYILLVEMECFLISQGHHMG